MLNNNLNSVGKLRIIIKRDFIYKTLEAIAQVSKPDQAFNQVILFFLMDVLYVPQVFKCNPEKLNSLDRLKAKVPIVQFLWGLGGYV